MFFRSLRRRYLFDWALSWWAFAVYLLATAFALLLARSVSPVHPVLLAVHTFTPELNGHVRRFDVGVLYEHHRGPAQRLGRALRQEGLCVRYNQPYSGMAGMMYAVDRHGTHHRLPCLELEVNQGLFERKGAARRLGRSITRGLLAMLPALEC